MPDVTSRAAPAPAGAARRPSSADLVAGGIFLGIGLIFALASLRYDVGSLLQMGPAYFPLAVAAILMALGAGTVVKGFVSPSRTEVSTSASALEVEQAHADDVAQAMDRGLDVAAAEKDRESVPEAFGAIPWRPLVMLTVALVFFALTLDGLGLLVTGSVSVVLASLGREGATWRQTLITAVALTLFSWLVFVVGLQLRLPLVGPWLGG